MTSSGSERRIVVAGRAVATQRLPPLFPARSEAARRLRWHAVGSIWRRDRHRRRRYDPGVPFDPVAASLDLVALEEPRAHAVGHRRRVRREPAPARAAPRNGSSTRARPPPTAGPGIHHVWARLFKDLYPRFHTMRGRYVARKGGWDCHGLPVEVEVEKELGIHSKHEIEDFGIDEFNQRCRESVQRYVEDWSALTEPHRRCGSTPPTPTGRSTTTTSRPCGGCSARCGTPATLYEGHKVVPYCGRCGTALSSHELGQPGAYRDITDPSVYVRFPVRRRATSTSSCGRPRRGRWSRTSAPRSAPTSSTCGSASPTAGATSCWRRRASPTCFGDDAEVVGAVAGVRPRRPAATSARSTASRRRESTARGSSPPTSSPPTTAPASCTSRPRSARSTARSADAEGLPMLNPVGRRRHASTAAGRRRGRARS